MIFVHPLSLYLLRLQKDPNVNHLSDSLGMSESVDGVPGEVP